MDNTFGQWMIDGMTVAGWYSPDMTMGANGAEWVAQFKPAGAK